MYYVQLFFSKLISADQLMFRVRTNAKIICCLILHSEDQCHEMWTAQQVFTELFTDTDFLNCWVPAKEINGIVTIVDT